MSRVIIHRTSAAVLLALCAAGCWAAAGITITSTTLPKGEVNWPYSATLAAAGGSPPYHWLIDNGGLPDGLTRSNETIKGTPTRAGAFSFTAHVTDSSGAIANPVKVSVQILPALAVTTTSLPDGSYLVPYTPTQLAASGGVPPYTWSPFFGAYPPGLNPVTGDGTISGTPTSGADGAGHIYQFQVQVTDSIKAVVTVTLTIKVISGLVISTDPTLPDGLVGAPYSPVQLVAQLGSGALTWQNFVGQPPSGMALSPAGTISGTPQTPGTFKFTVRVTDASGAIAMKQFTITILAQALQITTQAQLPQGTVGVPYTFGFSASGGAPPYTWTQGSGNLPGGLRFNAGPGTITGVPTKAGTFTFGVTVQDNDNNKIPTSDFAITIQPGPAILPVSCPNGTAGIRYSCQLTASGGQPPYSWSICGGSPGPDFTIDPGSGLITGIPRVNLAQNLSFTVCVKDQQGATGSQNYTVGINTLTVNTATLPNGTVGMPYSQTLLASGGTTPYQWTVKSGSLPNGLTLDPNSGQITGTPQLKNFFVFTVAATDQSGTSATKDFSIQVDAPDFTSNLSVSGLPATLAPNRQLQISIGLDKSYPLDTHGIMTLSFQPSIQGISDDPSLMFDNGSRAVNYTIAANSVNALFDTQKDTVGMNGSTTAGSVVLTLTLFAQSQQLVPNVSTSATFRGVIPQQAPAIQSVTTTATAAGFNVVITGFSTARAASSAVFTFTANSGVNCTCGPFTVPTADAATAWFGSSQSLQFGGMFTYTQPFTAQNAFSSLQKVVVSLTNSIGTSPDFSYYIPH